MLSCSAHGSPPPDIRWLDASDKDLAHIPRIRCAKRPTTERATEYPIAARREWHSSMALYKRCRLDTEDPDCESNASGPSSAPAAGTSENARQRARASAGDDDEAAGGDAGGAAGGASGGQSETPPASPTDETRCSVLMLPNEVLVAIMEECTYTEVAESLRLVCRRFSQVAALVLNAALYRVGRQLDHAMMVLEVTMESATTDNQMAVSARAFCALEFARMQWRLVEATVWRHGTLAYDLTSTGSMRVCCFGGRLLDRLRELSRLALVDPVSLAWSFHYGSAYRSSSARRRLSHDTKRFLNVFEKYAESRINTGPRVCGSKLIDLLFSLEDEKCVQVDWAASGIDADTGLFLLRVTFVLERAWFTSLAVESADVECNPRERQRYMFLRVRRLVAVCNENALERVHSERETLLRLHTPWIASSAQPFATKYAAFGHYADQFFYYGALNERAYEDRFHPDPLVEIQGGEGLLAHLAEAGVVGQAVVNGADIWMPAPHQPHFPQAPPPAPPPPPPPPPSLPAMEVRIHARLVCPPAMAPLAALRRLRQGDVDPLARAGSAPGADGGPFALELDVECAASGENRLPSRFEWRVSDADADADGGWLN